MCPPTSFKQAQSLDHLIKLDDLSLQLLNLRTAIQSNLQQLESLKTTIYAIDSERRNLLLSQPTKLASLDARAAALKASQRALRKERRRLAAAAALSPHLNLWLRLKGAALVSEQRVLAEMRAGLRPEKHALLGTLGALWSEWDRLRGDWEPAVRRLADYRVKEHELSGRYRLARDEYEGLVEAQWQAR